jgi:uncharacterized membrane protein YbhN (UPF0104 family)
MHAIDSFVTHTVDSLLGVSLGALAIAILLHLVKVAAEARAWHAIVAHTYRDVRFRTTFGAFAGAIGANAFLPGKIGEAFRLAIVRRRTRNSSSSTIAATMLLETAIEAVFSVVIVCAVLVAGESVGSIGPPLDVGATATNGPLLAGTAAVLLVAAAAAVRFRPHFGRIAADMAKGFAILRAPRALAHPVLSWKLVAWSLRLATIYWFLVAFHIEATPWTVLVVVAAQMTASLIPLLPGNAGAQQAALVVGLSGTAGAATVVGFGVGMQAATGISDLLLGTFAVALVASRAEMRAALARRPRLARA